VSFRVRPVFVTALIAAMVLLRLPLTQAHEHCVCGACCRDGLSETAAIATLRNLCLAQEQFRGAGSCDEDGDGRGEAGGFAELSGASCVRSGARAEPVLSSRFATVCGGRVEVAGYYFRIYLPKRGGGFVGEEDAGGFPAGTVDPDRAAPSWCAYAWPVLAKYHDHRTFFVTGSGDILATSGYGADDAPLPGAALDAAGQPAFDATGSDGRFWRQTG